MTYPRREKPAELLQLFDITEALFGLLQETFGVPVVFEVVLYDVDALDGAHENPQIVAALAMRETQHLRRAATDGVPVTNAEVVRIACALDVALDNLTQAPGAEIQAPTLLRTRDRINEGARVAAALGTRVDGGVVLLQ